jgi:hypothetical protein
VSVRQDDGRLVVVAHQAFAIHTPLTTK